MSGFTAVLLVEDPIAVAVPVAEALAAARKVPIIDVSREARSCWGLLGDKVPESDVQNLIAALKERGINAAALPTERLPVLPTIMMSRKIEISDEGFRCKIAKGFTPMIPWPAATVVAAAVINVSSFKNETKVEGPSPAEKWVRRGITMATGIPIPGARSRTVNVRRETTSQIAVLDIALERPAGRLRMEAESLDTSYLGARRGLDSMGNFKLAVADAAERAAPAAVNRGARIIQQKGNISKMGYDHLGELEREERWMMARRLLGA